MKHLHLDSCDSTQDVLKEQLATNQGEEILVSCHFQGHGRGRGENAWISAEGTLCLSFTLAPHSIVSFTALEVSLLVARYFDRQQKSLRLKWPNDLFIGDQKCAGVLLQGSGGQYLAGIGVNYFGSIEFGNLYQSRIVFDKKQEARKLYDFICAHRYDSTEALKREWEERCLHLGQRVTISEKEEAATGIFLGLGDYGEATLAENGTIKRMFNGSLRWD